MAKRLAVVQTSESLNSRIFEVRVYNGEGELIEIIDPGRLNRRHWTNFYAGIAPWESEDFHAPLESAPLPKQLIPDIPE